MAGLTGSSGVLGVVLVAAGQSSRMGDIDKGAHVVVHCRSGGRSANAVTLLRANGFENAWNVQGGILAWIDRIDSSVSA